MEVLKLEEKKRVEKVQKERKDTAVQTRHLRIREGVQFCSGSRIKHFDYNY